MSLEYGIMQPIARASENYSTGLKNKVFVFFVSLHRIINDNYDNYDNKKNVDYAIAGSTFHYSLFAFHCYGTGMACEL
jgi:hypothetical protein